MSYQISGAPNFKYGKRKVGDPRATRINTNRTATGSSPATSRNALAIRINRLRGKIYDKQGKGIIRRGEVYGRNMHSKPGAIDYHVRRNHTWEKAQIRLKRIARQHRVPYGG